MSSSSKLQDSCPPKKKVFVKVPYTIQYSKTLAKSEPPKSDTYEIAPHFAKYKVKLQSTEDETIKKVTGTVTIRIFENAGGWALEQHNNLNVEYTSGPPETIKTSILTWEKSDGTAYRFFTRRILNGEEIDTFRGEAKIEEDGVGYVSYYMPQSMIVKLPKGAMFPLTYLMQSLKSSMEGKAIHTGTIFDGASETLEPQEVNCFLGPPQLPQMSFSDPDVYLSTKAWPLIMAFYAPNSDTVEPEYELIYNVLNRCIIRDFIINCGTFTVKATISSLKIFNDRV